MLVFHDNGSPKLKREPGQNIKGLLILPNEKKNVSKYKWAATRENQQCGCAASADSDQPGHPPSLIRVFAVRMAVA